MWQFGVRLLLWEEGEAVSGWECFMIFTTPLEVMLHPFPQLRKLKQLKFDPRTPIPKPLLTLPCQVAPREDRGHVWEHVGP